MMSTCPGQAKAMNAFGFLQVDTLDAEHASWELDGYVIRLDPEEVPRPRAIVQELIKRAFEAGAVSQRS